MCLLCGVILQGGSRQHQTPASITNPGECTLHTRSCGAGVGIFFLVQRFSCLLVRGGRSCYYPSIYLDALGESGSTLGGGGKTRPLFLNLARYKKLEEVRARFNFHFKHIFSLIYISCILRVLILIFRRRFLPLHFHLHTTHHT